MALSSRARDWWSRRQAQQQAARDARDIAQIPVLHLQNSEEAAEPQWPTADVLAREGNLESEAMAAQGIVDIPLDFQTRTINPPRPRTVGAGYDAERQILRLKFRPGASEASPGGAVYDYFGVTEQEWWAVRHAISTGKFINHQLRAKDYVRRY